MINHDPRKNKTETTHFSNNRKTMQLNTILKNNLIITHKFIFHQTMKNTIIRINNDFPQIQDIVLTVLINQLFSNHTHKMNKKDNLELNQHLTTIIFNNKIQFIHIHTNQPRCIMKSHYHIIHNNTK